MLKRIWLILRSLGNVVGNGFPRVSCFRAKSFPGRVGTNGSAIAWTLLIIVIASAGPIEGLEQPDQDEPVIAIYLVSHGWHTGIVIKRAEFPSLLPERRDFPEAEYLEFGWGDREFYQAPAFSLVLALKAAFVSTGSVLHVTGFGGEVTHYFPTSEIVEFKLSREGFERLLVGYIHKSFAREGSEALRPWAPVSTVRANSIRPEEHSTSSVLAIRGQGRHSPPQAIPSLPQTWPMASCRKRAASAGRFCLRQSVEVSNIGLKPTSLQYKVYELKVNVLVKQRARLGILGRESVRPGQRARARESRVQRGFARVRRGPTSAI